MLSGTDRAPDGLAQIVQNLDETYTVMEMLARKKKAGGASEDAVDDMVARFVTMRDEAIRTIAAARSAQNTGTEMGMMVCASVLEETRTWMIRMKALALEMIALK